MGWLHHGNNGIGRHTCKHGHDMNKSRCLECQAETDAESRRIAEKYAAEHAAQTAALLTGSQNLEAAGVLEVEDIDDYERGTVIWRSRAEFEKLCPAAFFKSGKVYVHPDGIALSCKIATKSTIIRRRKNHA